MSKNNSKSLGSMRQKLRKYVKDFEEDMSKFRENPDLPDEEEEEKSLCTLFNWFYFNLMILFFNIINFSVQ